MSGYIDSHGQHAESKLNAEAVEFIPKGIYSKQHTPAPNADYNGLSQAGTATNSYSNYSQQNIEHSVENFPSQNQNFDVSRLPDTRQPPPSFPQSGPEPYPFIPNDSYYVPDTYMSYTLPPAPEPQIKFNGDALNQVKQASKMLTECPGHFDVIMPPLNQSLSSKILTESDLNSIVEELVKRSIEEANFRYTGARICNYFIHNLTIEFHGENFKKLLLKRCDQENTTRNQSVNYDSQINLLVGFTLFIAELLVNMDFESDKESQINLTTSLIELMETLLTSKNDACLKCVVQTLKLSGYTIEQFEQQNNGNIHKIDAIIETIKKLLGEQTFSRLISSMLLSVVELRGRCWDKRESNIYNKSLPGAVEPANSVNYSKPITQEAIFKSTLNPEAEQFCFNPPQPQSQQWSSGDDYYEDFLDEEIYANEVESEMDEEMVAAFEQFLAIDKKSHHT